MGVTFNNLGRLLRSCFTICGSRIATDDQTRVDLARQQRNGEVCQIPYKIDDNSDNTIRSGIQTVRVADTIPSCGIMDNVTDSIENILNKLLRYIRLEISETCAPAPRGIPDCNVHAILYTTNVEVIQEIEALETLLSKPVDINRNQEHQDAVIRGLCNIQYALDPVDQYEVGETNLHMSGYEDQIRFYVTRIEASLSRSKLDRSLSVDVKGLDQSNGNNNKGVGEEVHTAGHNQIGKGDESPATVEEITTQEEVSGSGDATQQSVHGSKEGQDAIKKGSNSEDESNDNRDDGAREPEESAATEELQTAGENLIVEPEEANDNNDEMEPEESAATEDHTAQPEETREAAASGGAPVDPPEVVVAQKTIKGATALSDHFPPLKSVVSGLQSILDHVEPAGIVLRDWERLARRVRKIGELIRRPMSGDAWNSEQVSRESLAQELRAIGESLIPIQSKALGAEVTPEDTALIQGYISQVERALLNYQMSIPRTFR